MNVLPKTVLCLWLFTIASCGTDGHSDEEVTELPIHRITGVQVQPMDRLGNNFFYTDTLRYQILFHVYTESEIIGYDTVENTSAETADDQFPGFVDNPALPGYTSLTFNKSVLYKKSAIEPFTNLLDRADITFPYDLSPFGVGQVTFSRDEFTIQDGEYSLIFQWGNEHELFTDTVNVHYALEN